MIPLESGALPGTAVRAQVKALLPCLHAGGGSLEPEAELELSTLHL